MAMIGILNVWRDMATKTLKIVIPNLQQLQVTTVKPELERMGLQLECYYLYSELPEGSIVIQSPVAGSEVPFGSKISLVIAYGKNCKKELLKVPGVVGLSYDIAVEVLNIKGFGRVQNIPRSNTTVQFHPCSIVTAQIPRKGMAVTQDTEIMLELNNRN
jgi:beta-lactam-binding protein with PASTA domain